MRLILDIVSVTTATGVPAVNLNVLVDLKTPASAMASATPPPETARAKLGCTRVRTVRFVQRGGSVKTAPLV